MSERNPIKNDARGERRYQRAGRRRLICLLCRCNRPEAMTVVNLPPLVATIFERHHIVGRAHDGRLVVPLCRTCHDVMTEMARSANISMRPAAHLLERLALMLRGLALFFPEVGKACERWAADVLRLATALDATYPGWRDMTEAK